MYNYNYTTTTVTFTTPTTIATSTSTTIKTITTSTTFQLQLQLQPQLQHYNFNNINPTTTTTATTAPHHTTSKSCGWGDHCNHCNHSKKHNSDSNHLSVHEWIRSAIHASQQLTSPIELYPWNFRHRLVRYYWCIYILLNVKYTNSFYFM